MECKFGDPDNPDPDPKELIDTLWNVNLPYGRKQLQRRIRINRYIMECKFPMVSKCHITVWRINRYIMECKYGKDVYIRKRIH